VCASDNVCHLLSRSVASISEMCQKCDESQAGVGISLKYLGEITLVQFTSEVMEMSQSYCFHAYASMQLSAAISAKTIPKVC
jgi:hypothetical protein